MPLFQNTKITNDDVLVSIAKFHHRLSKSCTGISKSKFSETLKLVIMSHVFGFLHQKLCCWPDIRDIMLT